MDPNPSLPRIRSHEDLVVWQKAVTLVELVYELSRTLPAKEAYGLTAQISRSVVSIPANIAEGHARETRKDFANFVAIARGSLMETRSYLTIGTRLGYFDPSEVQPALDLTDEIYKMLTVLKMRLQNRR
jgi:four helix bundle protein